MSIQFCAIWHIIVLLLIPQIQNCIKRTNFNLFSERDSFCMFLQLFRLFRLFKKKVDFVFLVYYVDI
jgi:hypothetical protein